MPTEDQAKGVQLAGRMVPFPRSISAEARRQLASFVGPDGRSRAEGQAQPPLDDHAAWAVARAAVEAIITQAMGPARAEIRSTIETLNLNGAVVHLATPPGAGDDPRAYLDIHGGALVHGGGEPCRLGAGVQADRHGVRCYAVDYRLAPEHPYPAGLDDCLAAYRAVLERHPPAKVIVGGASAGGNLAAALVLRARDEGLPLPAAVVLMTPELDLTESGDSFETNQGLDVILVQRLTHSIQAYAAGEDLGHPYLSPLFGDFTRGFPPTFLQAGTRDMFLSNAARMQRALRRAGVEVELQVFEGMPHGGFMGAPEDLEVAAEMARFVAAHWR